MSFYNWLDEAREAADRDLREVARLHDEDPDTFMNLVAAPGQDDLYTDNLGCIFEVDTSAYD